MEAILMELKNKNLEEFVSTIFNRNIADISLNDLSLVTSVSISNLSRKNGNREYGFEELSLFSKLKTVFVRESILSIEDVQVLSRLTPSLKSVEFQECLFEDENSLSLLTPFQNLSFVGCFHKNFAFVKNLLALVSLSVERPYNPTSFDMTLLENLPNLRTLSLEGCKLENQDCLRNFCKGYARLSLLDTTLSTVDFIDVLPNGAELFVSPEYMQVDALVRNQSRLIIRSDYRDYSYEEEEVKK